MRFSPMQCRCQGTFRVNPIAIARPRIALGLNRAKPGVAPGLRLVQGSEGCARDRTPPPVVGWSGRSHGVRTTWCTTGKFAGAPVAIARRNSLRKKARCEGGRCFNSVSSRRKSDVDNPCALRFLRRSMGGNRKLSVPGMTITFDIGSPTASSAPLLRCPLQ